VLRTNTSAARRTVDPHRDRGAGRVPLLRGFTTTVALLTLAATAPAIAQCLGDCSRDGAVTVNEIVVGVNIALESAPLSICPTFDGDGDDTVTVNELLVAVNHALVGCPPTPTATHTSTNTVTASPTGTATTSSTPTPTAPPTPTASMPPTPTASVPP